MYDYKNLRVWIRSAALSVEIDRTLSRGRRRGPPGLAAQLSTSCGSIAANIAEGGGYPTAKQSVRFVDIASGSASETENHLIRAAATGAMNAQTARAFKIELVIIRKMLAGFRRWLLRNDEPDVEED